MEENKRIFGERLRELRREKNLTLSELSEIFNISKSTLSRYENNLMNPTRDFQLKCSSFFKCSIDYLNGLTDIKNIATAKISQKQNNGDKDEVQQLNIRNYKDIEVFLNKIIDTLESEEGFTINGTIVGNEDIKLISDAIKIALKNIKRQYISCKK